ncbi:hypothetical protein Hypma_007312 [Hypsizygus marmoreus]|uniref:Uncharacterized protein n=1 Tax=Hypsizygus marmoreus TaxID=39966 RepID=A0A369K757_HYPMA|nr:hypothetical protein Hypma_007312 [Hypsizygus marmoreus]
MAGISITQSRLSEELWLLRELGYSGPDISINIAATRNKGMRYSEAYTNLRILDVIAVCLATGKPEDFVAAAFDKREQISLVLAKSGNVDAADNIRVVAFFSALKEAKCWVDMLPFLAKNTKENVDMRISKLHESITDLHVDLKSEANSYSFQSVEVEFPHSKHFFQAIYPHELPTANRILDDLFRYCKVTSAFELQNDQASYTKFVQLVGIADVLQNSLFLEYLISNRRVHPKLKGGAENLKRRLGKIYQYATLEKVIKLRKRLRDIPFYWVAETRHGMEEGSCAVGAKLLDVVEYTLGRPPSPELTDALRNYPHLMENWDLRPDFNPYVHVELRIILHLSRPWLSGSLPFPYNIGARLPVGCSNRSCLCCKLWIDSFNQITNLRWMMSGSNGEADDSWALPGAAGEMKMVEDWKDFDQSVLGGVRYRLVDKLAELTPKTGMGDFASSGLDDKTSLERRNEVNKLFGAIWAELAE